MKLFLLLISYVIFPVCLPNVLFGAEQEDAEPGVLYSCCLACQHDPCLCSMPLDEMVTSEAPSTDAQQQPMQGKRYQCTYPGCVYATAKSSDLVKHGRIHTGEKSYKCQHLGCEYAATRSDVLKVHERIHAGEKSYKCQYSGCKYTAAQLSSLIRHNLTHTGGRPHKCPYPDCEYAATRSDDLKRHIGTHTGEKPYECNSCEGKYLRFFQLRAHSKRIHGIEIPPKKGGRPSKRTQENLDNDKAGAPEDQETRRVHRDEGGDL